MTKQAPPIPLTFPLQLLNDQLVTVLSGAINYWGSITERDGDLTWKGTWTIAEYADEEEAIATHTLDRDALQRGLQVMLEKYPRTFSDLLTGGDRHTADLPVQLAIFGEEKYA